MRAHSTRSIPFGLRAALPAIAIALATPNLAHATLYDLNADWSDTANPNGVWQYRVGTSDLPSVSDWTPISNVDAGWNPGITHIAQPAWAPSTSGGNFLPAWFKSTATPASSGTDWLTGDVIVHTSDPFNGNAGTANVLFTAPVAGTAEVSGKLWSARNIGRANAWELFIDGIMVDSGSLPEDLTVTRANPATFDFTNVILAGGDTVELDIFRTSDPGDFVGVDLTVDLTASTTPPTDVPEPGTLALLGATLAGVAGWRRRPR